MAKAPDLGGDLSEWCDAELLKAAFLRGCKTGAGAKGGEDATLSVLKKIIDDDAVYKHIQTGEFAKHAKNNKMAMRTFLTKDWFLKMTKGNESKAESLARKIVDRELTAREKEAQGPKKGDDVTSRLTDASKYTGAHKERFDAEGKGKGKAGRVEEGNTTGYVGNYKGEGTFEDKK